MPREYIEDDMSPRTEGKSPFQVMVGWNRDHDHITVATVDPDVSGEDAFSASAGLHVHLRNRRSVNALIRNLRRARDQAFGRDE